MGRNELGGEKTCIGDGLGYTEEAIPNSGKGPNIPDNAAQAFLACHPLPIPGESPRTLRFLWPNLTSCAFRLPHLLSAVILFPAGNWAPATAPD